MEFKISLDTNKSVSENSQWLKEFLNSCKELDVLQIERLIEDDAVINNQSKWEFLVFIRDRFWDYQSVGIDRLTQRSEICILCNRGCKIIFLEAIPGKGIGLFPDYKKGVLEDLTICHGSTGNFSKQVDKEHWYRIYK